MSQPGMEPAVVVHPVRSLITTSTSFAQLLLIYCVKIKCRSDAAGYMKLPVCIWRTNKSETGYLDESCVILLSCIEYGAVS